MLKTLNTKHLLFAVSAMAGMLMTACDNGTESSQQAAVPASSGNAAQPSGSSEILQKPSIPTAEQIKAMEAMGQNRIIPATPATATGSAALAKTAGTDYNINFNDYAALSLPPDHDYLTFAPFYISQVRYGVWAYVMPMAGGHFHMSYENPNDCFIGNNGTVPSGKYGILSGGNCIVQGDAATQARYLSSHDATQQIQTYVWDGSKKYVFDLKSLHLQPNGGNAAVNHIQVWVHKIDVGWIFWSDLASGTGGWNYYFHQTGTSGAQGIDEVRVLSPNTSYNVNYDNMVINVH